MQTRAYASYAQHLLGTKELRTSLAWKLPFEKGLGPSSKARCDGEERDSEVIPPG